MTILPSWSRHTARVGVIPMVSSMSTPARLRMPMSCGCVPSPTPRLASSSSLRSNTTASQPVVRSRRAAIRPPSEPPITRARRLLMLTVIPGSPLHGAPERASRQRPGHAVVTGLVIHIGRRRIAVDQRAAIHRIGLAARLVLDGEQYLLGVEIDHVLEPVLVLIALHRDQAEIDQLPVRTGEIAQVNLHVMLVVGLFRRVGLAENKILLFADLDARLWPGAVLVHLRRRIEYLAIEPGNTRRRPGSHVEADIGHAELDAPEALGVRCMHMDAIAPRAHRLDAIVALAEIELGAVKLLALAHPRQPVEQTGAIRRHQSDDPAQHVGRAHRQMELAHADIDPHVARGDVEKRVARIAEPGDVIIRAVVLVGNAHVDVADADNVALVLGGAIVFLLLHGELPSCWSEY